MIGKDFAMMTDRDIAMMRDRDFATMTDRDFATITDRDIAMMTDRDIATMTDRDIAMMTDRNVAMTDRDTVMAVVVAAAEEKQQLQHGDRMSYGITYERLKQQHNGNPEVNHTVLQMRALKEILAAGGSYEEICECISLSAASASMPGSSTKIQSPGNQDSSFSSCTQFLSLSTKWCQ